MSIATNFEKPVFDSDLFTWNGGVGVAELTDLPVKHMPNWFSVISSKTDKVVAFYHFHDEYLNGVFIGWIFRAAGRRGFKIHIRTKV